MHTVKTQVSISMLWSAAPIQISQLVRALLSHMWVWALKERHLYSVLGWRWMRCLLWERNLIDCDPFHGVHSQQGNKLSTAVLQMAQRAPADPPANYEVTSHCCPGLLELASYPRYQRRVIEPHCVCFRGTQASNGECSWAGICTQVCHGLRF